MNSVEVDGKGSSSVRPHQAADIAWDHRMRCGQEQFDKKLTRTTSKLIAGSGIPYFGSCSVQMAPDMGIPPVPGEGL